MCKSNKVNKKTRIFANDYFFNHTLELMQAYMDLELKKINNLALIMLKPETIMMGKLEQTIKFLKENNFKVIYGVKKYLSNCQTSELWRYQWNAASLERIIVTQNEFETYPCLILVLESLDDSLLASTRMTNLKGSCFAGKREPHHLRSILSPINQALNYIHSADEPIDIIREAGIFFNTSELIALMDIIKMRDRIENLNFLEEFKSYKYAPIYNAPSDALDKILANFYSYSWSNDSAELEKVYKILNEIKLKMKNFTLRDITNIFKLIEDKLPWEFIIVLLTYIPYYNGIESIL